MSGKIFLIAGFLMIVAMPGRLQAQYNQYSQFHLSPVWLNPSHVGIADDIELTAQYRESKSNGYQFPSLSFSYPFLNKKTHLKQGGFGVGLMQEQYGPDKIYVVTQAIGGFAYNLPLTRHQFFSVGIQGGYLNKKIDPSKVTTDNQYIFGSFDPSLPVGENFTNTSAGSLIINTGFSWSMTDQLNRQKAYLGIAFFGVNRANMQLLQGASRDPVLANIHGFMSMPIKASKLSLIPNFRWIKQGKISYANVGTRIQYALENDGFSSLGVGLWYNTNRIGIVNLEYNTSRYRLAFAYNVSLTKNVSVPYVNNAWEVALSWRFKRKNAAKTSAQRDSSTPPAEQPVLAETPEEKERVVEQPDESASGLSPTQEQHEQATDKDVTPVKPASDSVGLTDDERRMFEKNVQFALNSFNVSHAGVSLLDSLADILKRHPNVKLTIVGHTCNLGPRNVNASVSSKRAQSVRALMIRKGVAPGQLRAIGKDFQEPLNANLNATQRAENRRVEFRLDAD